MYAQAVPGAALGPAGGGGAGAFDRWTEPVHIGLPTETMVLQAPVRIAEFNTLIQKALDILLVPIIASLHVTQINAAGIRELFTLTDACITPPLQNFIEQLSSRSAAARIVIDTQYYEQYLQRLRETTHGAHRQAAVDQLQEEYSRKILPLPPAVAQDPSFFQRTWAYITRRPPPAAQPSIAQMFPPGGAWGGVAAAPPGVAAPVVGAAAAPIPGAPVGPIAPAGVAAAPVAAAAAGAVAAYIPSDREVSQRSKMLEKRLRKNYSAAAEFIRNYRIPGQEGAVERSPIIIKSLYCNILTVFVHFTESLIKTIAHRLRRDGVLTRAESTAAAQQDALQGGVEVEIMLSNLEGINFLSRDQIDSLLEQLILIMVNYMNISPRFRDLIPLVSQIYSLATMYTNIADLDEVRPHKRLLTEVFSETLMDLVANIHIRSHNSMKRYVVNGDPWFASDGFVGKLGRLSGTLLKFVNEDKRVQVRTMVDEANRITVTRHEQTRIDVAREAGAVLCDIASPVFVAMDRLMELVEPVDFDEAIVAADGTRTRVRRTLRGRFGVAGQDTLEVGQEIAGVAAQTMTDLNGGLVRKLAAVGAGEATQNLVNALISLDDQAAAIAISEAADQGAYQQVRAALIATQTNMSARQLAALEPTPVSGMRGMNAGMNRGWSVATRWGGFADFETFMRAFQDYAQRESSEPEYIQFHQYIHSGEIQGHLNHFTYEQLSELYTIMDYEEDADWTHRYRTVFDLVDSTMSQPRFTENTGANNAPTASAASATGYIDGFQGYYGWDDLTPELFQMMKTYNASTQMTPLYRNWLIYVDNGFTTFQLPQFNYPQLQQLLTTIDSSRMRTDPLIVRIRQRVVSEMGSREGLAGNTEAYNSNGNNGNNGNWGNGNNWGNGAAGASAPTVSATASATGYVDGFQGYYGWKDLTDELFLMMMDYNTSTQMTPLYRNWLIYVDNGFTTFQLPQFTDPQLQHLLTTIDQSRMRTDPLIVRIRQRVVNEIGNRGGGGGGGGGGGFNTGRWGNESSNVSSANNGQGPFWNENPTAYREHINRGTRGNKSYHGIRSAKKHRKRIQRRENASRRNSGAARRNSGAGANASRRNSGAGSRRASTSKGAAQLEKKIKQALIGEQYPWGAGPEVAAKNYFEYEGGIQEIRQCKSLNLLHAISQLNPTSHLRKEMIQTARERLYEVGSINSYTPGSPFK
jgi:hypothetical protein